MFNLATNPNLPADLKAMAAKVTDANPSKLYSSSKFQVTATAAGAIVVPKTGADGLAFFQKGRSNGAGQGYATDLTERETNVPWTDGKPSANQLVEIYDIGFDIHSVKLFQNGAVATVLPTVEDIFKLLRGITWHKQNGGQNEYLMGPLAYAPSGHGVHGFGALPAVPAIAAGNNALAAKVDNGYPSQDAGWKFPVPQYFRPGEQIQWKYMVPADITLSGQFAQVGDIFSFEVDAVCNALIYTVLTA